MSEIPQHVGIIMDGNGRWAQKRGLPRLVGHHQGISALENIVKHADKIGIKYLSVYAFSTENWKRPQDEVNGLMAFFEKYINKKVETIKKQHGRMRFSGRRDRFSPNLLKIIQNAEEETKDETGIQFIICIDYGGRYEIVDAVKKIMENNVSPDQVTEELISQNIYLPDVPDVDLIIRTSGEMRTSNFCMWSGAYSELYFTDTLWPDFDEKELEAAVDFYSKRDRRKGGLSQ